MSFSGDTPTEEIDTPIELETYKLTCRLKIVQLLFRYVILILALGISGLLAGLGFIPSDYVVFILLIIVTYEVGANGSMIKELFDKILNRPKTI